ncbi:Protein C05D2.8 [Aphelenchoides avenae]|nr:Protein C05D2.8 [Aphelenchus avenae]
MAQRPNDTINLFFVIKVPGVGTFVNEQLPVTSNVKSVPSDVYYETESGFRVHCVHPMQEWQLSFRGNLVASEHCHPDLKAIGEGRKVDGAQVIPASFELKWSNYAEAVSRSLAREPWSRELFKKLKETHQSHYEQFGHLQGRFEIGEHSFDDVKMVSMRDHTITKYRNWSQIRRYIMLVYHLEDGTCINTSLVSMPDAVFSHLEFGYIITADKKKIAVDHININLYELGENKNFPRQFEYTFTAGPYFYTVKVNAKEVVSFKMGLDLACYVQEHMCEFRANGLKGWGFAEVEYRISPY